MEYVSLIGYDDLRFYVQLRDLKGHQNPCEKAQEIDKLRCFSGQWALVKLEQEEFLNELVFLRHEWTLEITEKSRKLCDVAETARRTKNPQNFDRNHNRFARYFNDPNFSVSREKAIILREANKDEKKDGQWYILDGNGRSLAYAMKILNKDVCYSPVWAYIFITPCSPPHISD